MELTELMQIVWDNGCSIADVRRKPRGAEKMLIFAGPDRDVYILCPNEKALGDVSRAIGDRQRTEKFSRRLRPHIPMPSSRTTFGDQP